MSKPALGKRGSKRGFSLLELLVAMVITLIVVGGVLLGFVRAMGAIQYAFLRAETQANARAAVNSIARDLDDAGSGGVPYGGITIPGGPNPGPNPFFARDGLGTNYLNANNFIQGVMYVITPAYRDGIAVPSVNAGVNSDGIVIVFEDSRVDNWPGFNWTSTPTVNPTDINAAGDAVTMPAGITPALNDPSVGLQTGDIVMLINGNGSAVGVVTGGQTANSFNMSAGDPLSLNGGVAALGPGGVYPPTTLYKLQMVSYFIQGLDANGAPTVAGPVDYRLMRQVNALPPVPIAEHIVGLTFSYDLSDPNTGIATSNVVDATIPTPGGGPPPTTPAYNQIRNIYLSVVARSQRTDAKGNYTYQTLYTEVSPRNLSFNDRYK